MVIILEEHWIFWVSYLVLMTCKNTLSKSRVFWIFSFMIWWILCIFQKNHLLHSHPLSFTRLQKLEKKKNTIYVWELYITENCIHIQEEVLKVDAQSSGSLLWHFSFSPWTPFIQMHMVINISLVLLIGTWI
jgi:hypothetical protein